MYIVEYKIIQKFNIYKYLEKCFFKSFLIKNQIIKFLNSQYKKLKKDKTHNLLLKERKELKKQGKNLAEINDKLNKRREYFHLTIKDLYEYVKPMQKKYKNYISSQMAQAICDDCFESFEKVIFSTGKIIHFKKYDDIMCLKRKKIDNGFTFKSVMDGSVKTGTDYLKVSCLNGQIFTFDIDIKDDYGLDAFRPLDVKYIQIVRKQFNNYYHYYVQFVTKGIPPLKVQKGKGNSGIDLGVSSVAAACDNKCFLEDLNSYSLRYEEKIYKKQNSLNRKLTINNQDKIENGKFEKDCKLDFSKNAKKDKEKLHTLQRKKRETDKQYKCKIANEILRNCDNIYIEPTNFNALKKCSKRQKGLINQVL